MASESPKFTLKDPRLWYYRCKVLRVVDGDTVMLLRDKGTYQYDVIKVRLAGIDAPERRPRVGSKEQRARERKLADTATNRLIELIGDSEVIIRTQKAGKFGRLLAEIYKPNQTKSVNDIMLEEGHAVVYGEPRPWRADEMSRRSDSK